MRSVHVQTHRGQKQTTHLGIPGNLFSPLSLSIQVLFLEDPRLVHCAHRQLSLGPLSRQLLLFSSRLVLHFITDHRLFTAAALGQPSRDLLVPDHQTQVHFPLLGRVWVIDHDTTPKSSSLRTRRQHVDLIV